MAEAEGMEWLRDSYAVDCPSCERAVVAEVRGESAWPYRDEDQNFTSQRHAVFLRCTSCHNPFLGVAFADYINQYGWDWGDPQIVYPAVRDELDPAVPEPIAQSFKQACACLRARLWTPTSIMCRRTLDGLCSDLHAPGRSLFEKLRSLRDQGSIDGRLFEWADALREAGNGAAHNVNVNVSKEDASDLIDFTRAILEHVFTHSEAFRRFQERRQQRRETMTGRAATAVGTAHDATFVDVPPAPPIETPEADPPPSDVPTPPS